MVRHEGARCRYQVTMDALGASGQSSPRLSSNLFRPPGTNASSEMWTPQGPGSTDMRTGELPHKGNLPQLIASRRTFRKLHRPTRMPTVISTTLIGRYLDPLRWLFGG
jgi:hypothetical protein